jgi:HD-like signal output (HDOD) protein
MELSEQLRQLEQDVVHLIARDEVRIPPYPAVALKVAALIRQENFGVDELARLVASDQRLSADVLRVAGSAAYGRGAPVSSVQTAVTLVGATEVATLALASGLGGQARAPGLLNEVKRQIWQESVTSALLCQKLGESRGQPGSEAFTAGLLHDFGRIVVAQTLEQLLERSSLVAPAEVWRDLIDRFHIEVGLVVAVRWNLSRLLQDVITLHHAGPLEACENPELLSIIMAVDEIVEMAVGVANLNDGHLILIEGLRSLAERELMARTYPQCPELIASFEGTDPVHREVKPDTKTAVEPPAPPKEAKGVDFKVIEQAHQASPFHAVGMGPTSLLVEGPLTLPLNRVVQLTLEAPGHPLKIWASPISCEPVEGGKHRTEFRPFALAGPAFDAWCALLRATKGE